MVNERSGTQSRVDLSRLRSRHRMAGLARRYFVIVTKDSFCRAGTRCGGLDLWAGIFQNGHHPVVR